MSPGSDVTVCGDVVLKRHAPTADAALLAAQLRVASTEPWSGVLLSPLAPEPIRAPDGRLLTLWPRVSVLHAEDADLPWAEAGALLARLHALPVPALQPDGAPARLGRALRSALSLPGTPDAVLLTDLARHLLRTWPGASASDRLVHGDFHFGQLGRTPQGALVLFDLDDLGVGRAEVDLGRPAGLHAAGVLPTQAWASLIEGYLAAGGREPHPEILDHAARASVVVSGLRALREGHSDDTAEALLDACRRMAELRA